MLPLSLHTLSIIKQLGVICQHIAPACSRPGLHFAAHLGLRLMAQQRHALCSSVRSALAPGEQGSVLHLRRQPRALPGCLLPPLHCSLIGLRSDSVRNWRQKNSLSARGRRRSRMPHPVFPAAPCPWGRVRAAASARCKTDEREEAREYRENRLGGRVSTGEHT
jgi:hypothetical protein